MCIRDSEYPARPPFVFVVKPRMHAPFVFGNGGMCMELLSTEGWSPATTVQALLTSVRSMWIGSDRGGKVAGSSLRLVDSTTRAEFQKDNSEAGARADFKIVMNSHQDWFGT